jgi:hypothetical protein
MFKVLRPLKDAYITNRVVNGQSQVNSNTGGAATLDLFKLYGVSTSGTGSAETPNTELSRLLIHFDLSSLRTLVAAGRVDPGDPSFSCRLRLHDVYGGQPTPSNFSVSVFPLSSSFDEGLGRDVVLYSDDDTCNWLSGSFASGSWYVSGCGMGGHNTAPCDYLTASTGIAGGATLQSTQTFVKGTEDLDVDVTRIVSATIAGLLPDAGFRVSFDSTLETNTSTYFVKRFAGRSAFNDDLHPKLYVRFDDSVQDDTENLYMDSRSYVFLYNYVRSAPGNLMSGSSLTEITGSNSLILQLRTPASGGHYSLYFTGSQHTRGRFPVTGLYSASVLVPSNDARLLPQWQESGSITFTPIWQSFDGLTTYLTGSTILALPPRRGAASIDPGNLVVTILGLKSSHRQTEQTTLRLNIFDHTSPMLTQYVKLPVELPGAVIRDVHYQVRDVDSDRVAIPFDLTYNSTRVSNDSAGMYFKFDFANLTPAHRYVVDVLVVTGDNQQLYKAASATFRVDALA